MLRKVIDPIITSECQAGPCKYPARDLAVFDSFTYFFYIKYVGVFALYFITV